MGLETSQSYRDLARINRASSQRLTPSAEVDIKLTSESCFLQCFMMVEGHEEAMIFPSICAHLSHFSLHPSLFILHTLH